MTTEIKRLIRVRTEKGASFKRDGFGKKRQLSDSWRKPRGQHNKQREQKKARGPLPKPGFGSPVAVRGMHPSGFFEVLVASVKEVEGLDSKTQAVRISAAVGDRKRAALQEAAIAAGLRVLNARTVRSAIKKAPVDVEETKKKETKSPPPRIQAKKETKKAQPAPDTKEKRAPVKSIKKAAKPKAEKSEEKQEISKANVPVKSAKKAAKPKAEKSEESQKANSKANTKPKADAKPKSKAKPKSGSEVKKND